MDISTNIEAGIYYNSGLELIVTNTYGSGTMYYTDNGDIPTDQSLEVPASIIIDQTTTYNFIVIDGAYTGEVVELTYHIKCSNPLVLDGTNFDNRLLITKTNGTTIDSILRYTEDLSEPTITSLEFDSSFYIYSTKTLTFKAFKDNFESSIDVVKTYTRNVDCVSPTVTDSCQYTTSMYVEITNIPVGASVYYTIDGTDPSSSSLLYTGKFLITNNCTVKVISIKSGNSDSAVVTKTYTRKSRSVTVSNSIDLGTDQFVMPEVYAEIKDYQIKK